MPLTDHPPAKVETSLEADLLYGESAVNATEKTCFWFRSEVP